MAAISTMSNYKLIYFLTEYRPIHDFVVDHSVFKVCQAQSMSEYDYALLLSNASVYQLPQCCFGDHFISESAALKKQPTWSLATVHPDIKH